jgi:hypothetical protein
MMHISKFSLELLVNYVLDSLEFSISSESELKDYIFLYLEATYTVCCELMIK